MDLHNSLLKVTKELLYHVDIDIDIDDTNRISTDIIDLLDQGETGAFRRRYRSDTRGRIRGSDFRNMGSEREVQKERYIDPHKVAKGSPMG